MAGELQVISDFYDLISYLMERIEKFPRHHRSSLGLAMEQRLQAILARLIRAKYTAKMAAKIELLADVNVELEVLRFQLRLAHDRKILAGKSHGHAISLMGQVGSQVGGWLRSRSSV